MDEVYGFEHDNEANKRDISTRDLKEIKFLCSDILVKDNTMQLNIYCLKTQYLLGDSYNGYNYNNENIEMSIVLYSYKINYKESLNIFL